MSTPVDKPWIYVQSPGERADAEAPSSVDAARVDDPIVATSDEGVQIRQSDAGRFWRKLIEAANQAKATCLAREAAGGAAPAQATKSVLPAAPCDVVAADAEAATRFDAARVEGPLGERVMESDPATLYMWRLLFDAIKQADAPSLAPEEPEVAAVAPPTKDVLPAAPSDVVTAEAQAPSGVDPANVQGQFVVPGDRVEESRPDTYSIGRQLIEALSPIKATWVAAEAPVVAAPAPPMREALPTLPFQLATVAAELDHLTTEKEVMAAVMKFANDAEQVLIASSNRVAALTEAFGSECVVAVTAACEAGVVALEEEAAVTGAPVTDQAAIHIARTIVDRVTQRASRTMALAPRVCLMPRVRTQRAPRARRAPRRAVRLSAVASAGDGPPPEEPSAPSRARDGVPNSLARERTARPLAARIVDARAALCGQHETVLSRGVRPFHAAPCDRALSWFAAVSTLVASGRLHKSPRHRASRAARGVPAAVHPLTAELRGLPGVDERSRGAEALRQAAGSSAAATAPHGAPRSVVCYRALKRRRGWPLQLVLDEGVARSEVNS